LSSNLDVKSITQRFFAAYDAHDVDGMLALCADGALGGTMPADVAGLVMKGEVGRIAHAYIIRYDRDGKISRLDCYWDNTAINAIKASAL
jgi:ketosteroid isomerase-like protein